MPKELSRSDNDPIVFISEISAFPRILAKNNAKKRKKPAVGGFFFLNLHKKLKESSKRVDFFVKSGI